MALSDWIVSTGAGVIAILIGLVSYFAKKWFESIDETIKEHSGDLKSISKQINTLEQKQSYQAEDITKAIRSQANKLSTFQIDHVEKEVGIIKKVIQEKLLPQSERLQENYGNIVVLESSMREQNIKIMSLYNIVKLLVEQKKKDQKSAQVQESDEE